MNISAKLKYSCRFKQIRTAKQKPSYVFNFNIDFPVKKKSSKDFTTFRSAHQSPLSKSPNQTKAFQSTAHVTGIISKMTSALQKIQSQHRTHHQGKKKVKNSANQTKTNANKKKNHTKQQPTRLINPIKEEFLSKQLVSDFSSSSNRLSKSKRLQSPSISRKTEKLIMSNGNGSGSARYRPTSYRNGESLLESEYERICCPSRKTVKPSTSKKKSISGTTSINSHRNRLHKSLMLYNGQKGHPHFEQVEEELNSEQLEQMKQVKKLRQKQRLSMGQGNGNLKSHIVRNVSILQKLVTDGNVIKYTSESSELNPIIYGNYIGSKTCQNSPKKTSFVKKDRKIFVHQSQIIQSGQDEPHEDMVRFINQDSDSSDVDDQMGLNISEIRQYEQVSTSRKQKLHFEYLREKILVEASVRKIQRAWRNYLTKKLVNSYSARFRKKDNLQLTVSEARFGKNKKDLSTLKKDYTENCINYTKKSNEVIGRDQQFERDSSQEDSNQGQNQERQSVFSLPKKAEAKFFDKDFKNLSEDRKNQSKNHIDQKSQQSNYPQVKNVSENGSDRYAKSVLQEKNREIKEKLRKFQEEEIKKWESILQSIKKGNNIEKLLEKSQSYKKQLQVNLKQISKAQKQSQKHKKIIEESSRYSRASPILFRTNSSRSIKSSNSSKVGAQNFPIIIKDNLRTESERQLSDSITSSNIPTTPLTPYEIETDQGNNQGRNPTRLYSLQPQKTQTEISKELALQSPKTIEKKVEENSENSHTAERRREKILFFENQILKIDNQQQDSSLCNDYEENDSSFSNEGEEQFRTQQTLKPFNFTYEQQTSVQNVHKAQGNLQNTFKDIQQREKEENLKLRKKLQLFNTHFLDLSSAEEGLTDRSLKNNSPSGNLNFNEKNKHQNRDIADPITRPLENERIPLNQSSYAKQTADKNHPSFSIRLPQPIDPEEVTDCVDESYKLSEEQKKKHREHIEQLINHTIEYPQSSEESSLEGQQETEEKDIIELQQTHRVREKASPVPAVPHLNLNDLLHESKKISQENEKLNDASVLQEKEETTVLTKEEIKKKRLAQKVGEDVGKNNYQSPQINGNQFTGLNFQQKRSQQHQNFNAPRYEKFKQHEVEDILKICASFEEELIYEVLLEFSDSDSIVLSIKNLFDSFRRNKKSDSEPKKTKKITSESSIPKPEGICTNLQSIKDYLENFVGFVFENKLTAPIEKSLLIPNGPTVVDLLKYLRKNQASNTNTNTEENKTNSSQENGPQSEYIMEIQAFEEHWKYANANIYFDRKYPNPKTEEERVNYLKGLTRVYFRAIFDAFNESLEYERVYGIIGKPYPWSVNIHKKLLHLPPTPKVTPSQLQNSEDSESTQQAHRARVLKSAFQHAYRRILKISVVFCGVHFDDKSHLLNEEAIREIQEQRLLNLITMELEEDEFRWSFFEDELAEVKYDLSQTIENEILEELLRDLSGIKDQ